MQPTIQDERWQRALEFNLDHLQGDYNFTLRLAHENKWTKHFTELAILEYKKFMYLAAISDEMVSPSETVDRVWHQHLVFSQSYQDFCSILGKQIQHVPSTHSKEQKQRFKEAKDHTTTLYENVFGQQPRIIWQVDEMYDTLNLPKAKIKLRAFVVIGLVAMIVISVPLRHLLEPLFIRIDNPDFLIGTVITTICLFVFLEVYNRRKLDAIVNGFDKDSFIFQLDALEAICLKSGYINHVIHAVANRLYQQGLIGVQHYDMLVRVNNDESISLEERQLLDTIADRGPIKYARLLREMKNRSAFFNIDSFVTDFQKYIVKSKRFANLFKLNVALLATVFSWGIMRFMVGLSRDKPIGYLGVFLLLLVIASAYFLDRITHQVARNIIPDYYRLEVLPRNKEEHDWRWMYFMFGASMLAPAMRPFITDLRDGSGGEPDNHTGSSSGCGSSCGSNCGSSCGGCGGGD